jgi:hypothetical protein
MADIALLAPGVSDAPEAYMVPGAQEIILKAVTATFDGSGAAGQFQPTLQIVAPNGTVLASCPSPTVVAAGASADVSWFPRGGVGGGSSGGGSGFVQVFVDTPDASANAVARQSLSGGFTTMRRLAPYLLPGGDGYWTATVRVPPNYGGSPVVKLSGVADASLGAVRLIVGTAAIADGSSEDVAFTDEAAQNVTVPGTPLERFDTSFAITGSSPAAGDDLMLKVERNGANGADTCTAQYGLWAATFEYSPA